MSVEEYRDNLYEVKYPFRPVSNHSCALVFSVSYQGAHQLEMASEVADVKHPASSSASKEVKRTKGNECMVCSDPEECQ